MQSTIGRPSTVAPNVRAIHARLQQEGIAPGTAIPRHLFDAYVARVLDLSASQVQNVVRTGELHLLWRRENRPGNRGNTIVLEADA